MPVEIRELIIKTEISVAGRQHSSAGKTKDMNLLKKQLLDECKRIIAERTKKNDLKR